MGIGRSTYYDQPVRAVDDTAIVEAMFAICDAFEAYGYRRVGAALRQQGLVVNHKKIRRLMREHALQPRIRRRFGNGCGDDEAAAVLHQRVPEEAELGFLARAFAIQLGLGVRGRGMRRIASLLAMEVALRIAAKSRRIGRNTLCLAWQTQRGWLASGGLSR